MKIPDSVLKFSDNVDLFKAWGDYFNHYRAVNFNAKKDYDTSLNLNEKSAKLNKAITAEVNKVCGFATESVISERVWATNPQYRWAGFAIVAALIDAVLPDVVVDSFGRFAEPRFVDFGDSLVFDIKSSDLYRVSKNGNSRRHISAQRDYTGQVSLIPRNRAITVTTDLYSVLCGKEDLAATAMKIFLSMESEISKDIYYALSDSHDGLHAKFRNAGYTQSTFIELRNRVSAANGGVPVVCYGTQAALSEILPTSDFLKLELSREYTSVGYISNFMGTQLVAFPQKLDWSSDDFSFILRDDELFLVGAGSQKLVQLGVEGNLLVIQDGQYDGANLGINTTFQKRWEAMIATNSRYGIIRL